MTQWFGGSVVGGGLVGVSVVGGFNKVHLKANRPSTVTNCDESYYKLRPVDLFQTATKPYYKIVTPGLSQIEIGITNCDKFITNCDGYYKLRRLLPIATEKRGGGEVGSFGTHSQN